MQIQVYNSFITVLHSKYSYIEPVRARQAAARLREMQIQLYNSCITVV